MVIFDLWHRFLIWQLLQKYKLCLCKYSPCSKSIFNNRPHKFHTILIIYNLYHYLKFILSACQHDWMCFIYNQFSQKYIHRYNKCPVYQREMLLSTIKIGDLGSIYSKVSSNLWHDGTGYNQTLLSEKIYL